ncbi:MAG: hypothetical protein JXQ73_17070 [Phycisphaerae bacterium]|nr:hypothetical protein [Phycisphaerae bacterium]
MRTDTLRIVLVSGTAVSAAAYCGVARCWQTGWDALYDVPGSLTVFSFMWLLVVDGLSGMRASRWWWSVAATLGALLIVATTTMHPDTIVRGHVSGHMTMVLLVAIIQTGEARLPAWLRIGYWIPVPIVAALRIFYLHGCVEAGLVGGVLAGAGLGLIVTAAARGRSLPSET